jgi:hypothetical protein
MAPYQEVSLTATEAAELLSSDLAQAGQALGDGDLPTALDSYARALGLALQLGPAPAEQVLAAVCEGARVLFLRQDAAALSALGPAVVGLVAQVRDEQSLPRTRIMDAWATIASDVGALIGQVGLVMALPRDHRPGMLANARRRAELLDEATGARFAFVSWLEDIEG